MKRFSGTELAALALAAILFLGGASMVIWPQRSGVFLHGGGGRYVGNVGAIENMSAPKSRLCGIAGMAFGVGLAAFTIYRKNP